MAGTGQPAPVRGGGLDVRTTTPPVASVQRWDVPVLDIVGAVVDPAGRRWARTDVEGSGAVGIRASVRDVARSYEAELVAGSGWWLPNGATGTRWIPLAWPAGAGSLRLTVSATRASGGIPMPVSVVVLADPEPPAAAIDPLAVEQGELVLRWRDSDGSGSGIVDRTVRVERAPATAAGCGEFAVIRQVILAAGDDPGRLALGRPPASDCLRASLVLGDRVGHVSVTTSEPYRIRLSTSAPVSKADAAQRWTGRFNLFRPTAFVTQKTFRWCVAASVQMMVNLVRNHADRTVATQRRMIMYAQRWDNGPYGEEGGTDVTGWITALRHFGAGNYRAVGATTAEGALRIAATAMRQTGRPAGILVMEGRHAWVLHGFESRTDPRLDRRAVIRAVRISGPLFPVQQKGGYDPRPNTRLTARALARYFQPSIVGALAGKYVVVIPAH